MGTLAKTLDGLKILLIEDDEDTREVLTLGLGLYGADVTPVSSASAALVALDCFSRRSVRPGSASAAAGRAT